MTASLACLLILAAAWPALGQQTPAPSDLAFPSGVEVVTVDVVVLDGDGQPVEGLQREDFVVKEDGKPQVLGSFEAVRVPESAPTPSRTRSRISTSARAAASVERTFVLVFDDANVSQYATPHAKEAITTFLRDGLRPGDQVMVVPTSGGAWWSGRVPEDRESLLAYVSRLEGKFRAPTGPDRIWDHEAMVIWMNRDPKMISYVARRWYDSSVIPESYPTDREVRESMDVSPSLALIRAKAQETYMGAVQRLKQTLLTLTRVAESMAALRGRKNLLLVSEGFIMDPSQSEFRDLVQAARRSNTAVHFLDARGTSCMLGETGMPGAGAEGGRAAPEQDAITVLAIAAQSTEGARSVALDTGGSIVPATAGLGRAMSRIADETKAYYLVGYVPQNNKRDGGYRKISVEVERPGKYTVRSRRGYYAPRTNEKRREDPDRLDPRVRAALDAPFGATSVPLRLTSYVIGAGEGGKVPVLLLGEADLSPLDLRPKAGVVQSALETFVVVQSRDGREAVREEKLMELSVPEAQWEQLRKGGVPVQRVFQLAPGVYQARLLVRERDGGRIGTVRHEFEVRPANGFRLSTPILTDAFQAGVAGEPARPIPVARRTFRPGAQLGYAYEAYGAASDPATALPRLTASYVVRRADGTVLASPPARALRATSMAAVAQVIVFTAPTEPGEYDVVLTVRDEAGGVSAFVTDAFTLEP